MPAWISERYVEEDRGHTSPCWIWQLYVAKSGYGYGHDPETHQGALAHRLSYEEHVGPIPDGLVLDHLCRVKTCVNPKHLEAVPQRTNVHRGNAGSNLRAAAKLSPQDRDDIRMLRETTNLTLRQIAEKYGVSEGRVWQIASGKSR